MSVFGPIVAGGQVSAAVTATLQKWLPTYLREMERRYARTVGVLPVVRSWPVRPAFQRWPEDQLPAAVIVAGGLTGQPSKDGDGNYQAEWAVGVGMCVIGPDPAATVDLRDLYTTAALEALLQNQSLGGFAEGVVWIDLSYDDIPVEQSRTGAAGLLTFGVLVADVASSRAGPATPDPLPDPTVEPGDWPTVQEVDITLEARSLT